MKFRHEWKHEINYADYLNLRPRLGAVMTADSHARNGTYQIRSLYFDSPTDKALREKIDGVNHREKFRIRYYDGNTDFLNLEKKSKINSLCSKEKCPVTKEEVEKLLNGDFGWLLTSQRPLCVELYAKMKSQGLRPKTIVDYSREPYIYPPGNVRVTVDYNLRLGAVPKDFLNPDTVLIPAGDAPIIMEVKWDEYLPSIIKDAVMLPCRRAGAFSKYRQCRIYG